MCKLCFYECFKKIFIIFGVSTSRSSYPHELQCSFGTVTSENPSRQRTKHRLKQFSSFLDILYIRCSSDIEDLRPQSMIKQDRRGPLSLVEECRGSTLIGREDYSVAPPALLCHKEPAPSRGLWMPELVLYGIRELA